ncbi:MAG TPA: PEGA domain-containing protein, partial [Kofleriaceae bacterium]|nr:PEGA domain-containing protein [Kofleriaceae bacterium]
ASGVLPQPRATTNTGGKSITTFTGKSRRGWWLTAAVVAIAGGGAFAVWKVKGNGTDVVVPAAKDAGVAEQFGVMEIDPKPNGAKGTITGVDGIAHAFGPTPVRQKVSANTKLHVHIELPGYQTIDDDRTVPAGETMVIAPHMIKARASLHVTTTPPGAQVSLEHRVLGDTPLVRDDLDEVKNADLVIAKAGFDPIREKVDLVVGHPIDVTETLKVTQHFGTITLNFTSGWGDITFKGAKVGTNSRISTIRLPVGKQTLHIRNPPSGKQWDVTCNVEEGKTNRCTTALP